MRYETIENLKDEDFNRYTGVSWGMVGKTLKAVREGMHDFGQTPELTWAG